MTKLLSAALVLGLVLTVAACGSSDDAAPTTTAKSGSTVPDTVATTTTLDDSEYDKFAQQMDAKIAAAGNDQCKLEPLFMELSAGTGTAPATPEQVEQAVGLTVDLFNALAASAGPARAKEAQDVRAGAEKITAAAKENNYSVEWIRSPDASNTFGQDFVMSLAAIRNDILKNCNKGQQPG